MSDAEKEVESAEEGEITDDEEPVVEEPSHDQQENAEEAAEDILNEPVFDGGNRFQDEGGEENEDDAEAEAARRARRERKKAKRDKDRKRHRERDRGDRERELDSDEEKKRRLKKKLAALEMQMQEEGDEDEDDEAMGIYGVNGGSPSGFGGRQRRRRRPAVGASGSESPSDGAGSDGERSPERKRKKSRERRRERRAADKRRRPEKSGELCQLFMMGKCPKSPERCIFSHDAQPPQIFELCKFYLFDRCAKKEKCLYLHKGFPCKYFHTGHRCMDTAESCKFSHEPLVEETRNILLKHLEAAPKEILGDFPRMSREQALNLVCKTECENKGWTSHPLMEQQNRQAQQQQPPPLQQQNPFGGPQVGDFANPPRQGGFDQGQPMQPGPPRAHPRDPFAPPAGPGGFGRDDFGPPQTPGLLGPAPPQVATASIQERLVQLSGGMMNDASGRPPPQPLMGVAPGGGMAVDPAPVGGSGGERRRKSRWENQEQLPLPPPSLLQHPGATFRPPLINQPFNNQQQHMGPAAGPPPQQQPHPLPPQSHRPIGIRPVDPGFNVFDQVDQRNGRKDPAAQRMGASNEDDPEDGDAAGQRTPPNTEPNPFGGDESDPFNPASEDADSPPPPNSGNSAASAPSGMPKAQQRLYERIQEKQLREKSGSPSPRRDEAKKPRMNEGWYSSDEENNSSNKAEERTASSSKLSVSLPKELSDVISSLRKSPGKSPGQHQQQDVQEGQRGSRDPRKRDPRRDPRRNSAAKHAGGGADHTSNSNEAAAAERERDKRILEMDLGSVFGDLDLPLDNNPSSSSAAFDPAENDMGLPFKPHVVASVAKEIDASIYSHSPLLYRLRAIAVAKPDYSDLVNKQRLTPAQSQDPRLRRYAPQAASINSDGESMNHGYNPGQDLGRTKRRDPRRRD